MLNVGNIPFIRIILYI